jgi:hypothetical protein
VLGLPPLHVLFSALVRSDRLPTATGGLGPVQHARGWYDDAEQVQGHSADSARLLQKGHDSDAN